MKSNVGEIIRNLRKNLEVSQEELANRLFMDRGKLSRIESGEGNFTVDEFCMAFFVLGIATEDFWIAYLTWEEFEGYRVYRKIREFLKRDKIEDARDIFPLFKENPLAAHSFMRQFVNFLDILLNTELSENQKITEFCNILEVGDDFSVTKICEYRPGYTDLLILNEISLSYSRSDKTECQEKAIKILTSIAKNIDNFCITLEEKTLILPKPQVCLYKLLMNRGEYEKAADICKNVLALAKIHRSQYVLPVTTYSLGVCYHKTGKSKEEYMPLLITAYHAARCIEQHEFANRIRKEYDIS